MLTRLRRSAVIALATIATTSSATFALAAPKANPKLKTDDQKIAYALGFDQGSRLLQILDGTSIDTEILLDGMRDAFTNKESPITETERQKLFDQLNTKLRANNEAKGEQAKKVGSDFLEKNKKVKGVVVTKSGLQYQILTPGTGPVPGIDDSVTVHYRGTLIDGTEFDSSYARKEPASFPLKGVIKGWTEALQLMPVGSKWKLVIPTDLGYGPQAAGKIPPNSTLIFEVELLSIQEQKKEEPAKK